MSIRRIVNARVLTMDDGPAATWVEIDGGRIAAVGGSAATRGASSGGAPMAALRFDGPTATLDLGGRTLVPGFIDCHLHLLMGGLALTGLDLGHARSREDFERAVDERHAALPPGAWLLGGGWSEQNWPDRSAPDNGWLRRCGDRPAVLHRMDRHACVVNAAVLSRIETRVDPIGGRIVRDRAGTPTGLLLESAAWSLLASVLPRPGPEEKRAALAAAVGHVCAHGITTVMSMELADDVRTALAPACRGGAFPGPRILVTLLDRDPAAAIDFARSFAGDDRLRIIGAKAFLDGTLGSRTARMLEPYSDAAANCADPCGIWVEPAAGGDREAALRACVDWTTAIAAAGLSPSMHAIGDAALRLALDVGDAVPAAALRIEHAQTAHPDDVRRTRGRRLSMQPLHKADDGRFARNRLGDRRMERFFPYRRYLDAGAVLGFGSDWPIVQPDAVAAMRAAITALTADGDVVGEDQSLAPIEALRGWTCDAARLLGVDTIGAIRPGAAADFAALSHDPLAADWRNDPPRVEATVCGGELAWRR